MPTTFQRIAIDLNPAKPEARPPLEQSRRYVFLAVFLVGIGLCLTALFNVFGAERANKFAGYEEQQIEEVKSASRIKVQAIEKENQNRARAQNMGKWVSTALDVQPFVITALDGIPKDITVESFNLKLTEGQAQIDGLELVLLGDTKLINQQIDAMAEKLQAAGCKMLSPDPTPTSGGVRFHGRFIYKPADQMNWSAVQ